MCFTRLVALYMMYKVHIQLPLASCIVCNSTARCVFYFRWIMGDGSSHQGLGVTTSGKPLYHQGLFSVSDGHFFDTGPEGPEKGVFLVWGFNLCEIRTYYILLRLYRRPLFLDSFLLRRTIHITIVYSSSSSMKLSSNNFQSANCV